MINQITLVGRLVRTPELDLTENGKKVSTITLAVPREYKNMILILLIVPYGLVSQRVLVNTVRLVIFLVYVERCSQD